MADDQRLRELMREYQSGRFEAFDDIYASIAPAVRRYLLSQARDGAKADDLVQETFLQMHRARHTYDSSFPLMPWAMAIARHVWLMDRRARSRRPWAPDDVADINLSVRGEAASFADRDEVRRALGQVAPARREAVIQHHVLGFSFREIAQRAGIAETAAKLRSSRGMAQLRALLKAPQKAPKPEVMSKASSLPEELRARLTADYQPVRALRSPWMRALWIAPLGLVALMAAPVAFDVRSDAADLGWLGVWGFSIAQAVMGLGVIGAALRESIPGRDWSRGAVALWLALPIAAMVGVTLASWNASDIFLRSQWWLVAGVCFAGSAATALPVVALASILAARAYPTRPAVAGALLGLGAGLMADAGWRIFCHFGEPAHVLSAHLAAVIMSTMIGALAAVRLCGLRGKNTRSTNQ